MSEPKTNDFAAPSSTTMDVACDVAGSMMRVCPGDAGFAAYARYFLGSFKSGGSGLNTACALRYEDNTPGSAGSGPLARWGTEALIDRRGPLFAAHMAAGIWCRPSGTPEDLRVSCEWRPTRLRRMLALARSRMGARDERYMTMLRHGLLQPVTAQLLQHEGIVTLHASAVEHGGRAVVFTGLNGCGKSGLALHLVTSRGFRFMADNFALIRPGDLRVFAFPEPIRVGEVERPIALSCFSGNRKAYGKWQMTAEPENVCHEAALSCLVHVTIGERFGVKEVPSVPFARRLESLHRFLGETAEYSWVQLHFMWQHGIDLAELADAARRELCASVRCYEMTLPRADDFDSRYEEAVRWVDCQIEKQ